MDIAEALTNAPNAGRSIPLFRRQLNLTWWISLIALSALMFIQISQTKAVIVFMAAVVICGGARPYAAFNAILQSKLLWPFLLYAALSVTWSSVPDLTARGATQLIFTTGAAVLLAQALSPKSFVAVLMGSCMIATVASIIYLGPALISQLVSGVSRSRNIFGVQEYVRLCSSSPDPNGFLFRSGQNAASDDAVVDDPVYLSCRGSSHRLKVGDSSVGSRSSPDLLRRRIFSRQIQPAMARVYSSFGVSHRHSCHRDGNSCDGKRLFLVFGCQWQRCHLNRQNVTLAVGR